MSTRLHDGRSKWVPEWDEEEGGATPSIVGNDLDGWSGWSEMVMAVVMVTTMTEVQSFLPLVARSRHGHHDVVVFNGDSSTQVTSSGGKGRSTSVATRIPRGSM